MLIAYPWQAGDSLSESPHAADAREDGFPSRLRGWLAVVVAVGMIEALYGAYQVVTRHPQIYWLQRTAYLDSATGTFVYRGHLAGYFELVIPISIALALTYVPWQRRRKRRRHGESPPAEARGSRGAIGVMLLIGTALMLGTMGLTQSRGGVLSSLASLAIGALTLGAWQRQLTLRRIAIGAAVLASLAVVWLQSPRLLERFGTELRLTPYSRPSVWRETLNLARDFPVLGVGLGNFEFVFPRYQPAGTRSYFDRAHNDYLQLVVEAGVLGGACFAWLFWQFFALLVRRKPGDRFDETLLALGLTTAVVALLLHSWTDFNLHIPANTLLFVVALGAAIRLLDHGTGSGLQGRVPLRSRAFALGVIAAAGVVGVVIVRNWWVESLVRSIFPNSSLIDPLARPPDSLAVRVRSVGVATRIAGGQAEVAEAVGWLARQLAEPGMRDRAALANDARAQQTADAWAAAAHGYRRMVELRPSVAYAHLRLGEAVASLAEVRHGFELPHDVIAAVTALFDRAVRLQPRDMALSRSVSEWALTRWGQLTAAERPLAIQWTRHALDLDPLRGRQLLRLAIDWDPELPAQLLPDNPEVRLYLALAYKDAERPDDAARVAVALDDELGHTLHSSAARFADAQLLGRVREFRGDPRGAAEAYGRAGVLASDDGARADALKRSGYNWLGAADLDKAQQALSAARRYGGRDPDVLAGLSAIAERRDDFATAARWLRDALSVAPAAADYRYRLARLYEHTHEYGKANEQYRRLLDEPASPFVAGHRIDIFLNLARNYRQLELSTEARRFYNLVLQQDADNLEAREFLSYFGS